MHIRAISFINTSELTKLRRFCESGHRYARSRDERADWAEAVACLTDAQPGYLCNLIPQDHPDRGEALRMILETYE